MYKDTFGTKNSIVIQKVNSMKELENSQNCTDDIDLNNYFWTYRHISKYCGVSLRQAKVIMNDVKFFILGGVTYTTKDEIHNWTKKIMNSI